jgi:bacillithiol system protein YtxJ
MAANIIEIASLAELDALFENSHLAPVILFKHSDSCGISADLFEQISVIQSDIHIVVVQTNRSISDSVAVRTGFRHQSPQAFVLKSGKPVYQASHYGIDIRRIIEKLTTDN